MLYNKSLRLHFFFLYFMDVGDRKSERHGRRKGRKKNSNLYDLTFLCFARLLSETFGPFFLFCNLHIRQKKFFFVLFLPERIRHSGQVYSGPVIKPLRVVESSRSEMTLSLSQSQIVSTLVWRTFRSQSWRDISAFRLISRYFPKRNSKSAQKRKSNQSGNRSRSGRQGQRFFVLFFLKHSAKV